MSNILDAFKEDQTKTTIDTTKKLRIGFIGTGWIAGAHIIELKKMPDVEIVAGADIIEGKAEKFFEEYDVPNVKCYRSHTELLANENLDAVTICTYNSTHAVCAIDAMKAGVHVLLEKPMCVTLEEAIEISGIKDILFTKHLTRFGSTSSINKNVLTFPEVLTIINIESGWVMPVK